MARREGCKRAGKRQQIGSGVWTLCFSSARQRTDLLFKPKQRGKQEGKTTLSKYTTVCEMNSCIAPHLRLQIWQHWWSQQNCVLSHNSYLREPKFSFGLPHSAAGISYCILGYMVEPEKSDFPTTGRYVFALQISEGYSDCSLILKAISQCSATFVHQQNKENSTTSISCFSQNHSRLKWIHCPRLRLLGLCT